MGGRPSTSPQLAVWSAGQMLDNLEPSWHLAGIDPLEKQFGEALCRPGRADDLG